MDSVNTESILELLGIIFGIVFLKRELSHLRRVYSGDKCAPRSRQIRAKGDNNDHFGDFGVPIYALNAPDANVITHLLAQFF